MATHHQSEDFYDGICLAASIRAIITDKFEAHNDCAHAGIWPVLTRIHWARRIGKLINNFFEAFSKFNNKVSRVAYLREASVNTGEIDAFRVGSD